MLIIRSNISPITHELLCTKSTRRVKVKEIYCVSDYDSVDTQNAEYVKNIRK